MPTRKPQPASKIPLFQELDELTTQKARLMSKINGTSYSKKKKEKFWDDVNILQEKINMLWTLIYTPHLTTEDLKQLKE